MQIMARVFVVAALVAAGCGHALRVAKKEAEVAGCTYLGVFADTETGNATSAYDEAIEDAQDQARQAGGNTTLIFREHWEKVEGRDVLHMSSKAYKCPK